MKRISVVWSLVLFFALTLLAGCAGNSAAPSMSLETTCANLNGTTIDDVTITSTKWYEASGDNPAFCQVNATRPPYLDMEIDVPAELVRQAMAARRGRPRRENHFSHYNGSSDRRDHQHEYRLERRAFGLCRIEWRESFIRAGTGGAAGLGGWNAGGCRVGRRLCLCGIEHDPRIRQGHHQKILREISNAYLL